VNQHIGSLFMDPKPFLQAVKNFLALASLFDSLEFVDFGGGFGVPYKKLEGEESFNISAFSSDLLTIISEWRNKYGRNVVFKSEPGRYIAAEAGVLLGRVHAVKYNADVKYIGSDIGMNVIARPAMYNSWHDIELYRNGQFVNTSAGTEAVTVVGNICETGDILASNRILPIIYKGDILCLLDAGAYGYSMSSNYNNRLRPAEVMIDLSGNHKLIRRRETLDDLMKCFPEYSE
jgi:diaminopimelate decarboxylase